jgi:hypothetical protein
MGAPSVTNRTRGDIKTQVANRVNGALISQYDYVYDAIGRRTSVKSSGSAFAAPAFTTVLRLTTFERSDDASAHSSKPLRYSRGHVPTARGRWVPCLQDR